MIIVLKPDSSEEDLKIIVSQLERVGLKAHISKGEERTLIGAIGDERVLKEVPLEVFHGVEQVIPILRPYKLVSRDFQKWDTVVEAKGVKIGGGNFQVIAGPCSVEGEEMIVSAAKSVQAAGARFLRGGAFKPRTSPYDFQGHGEEGLKLLSAASAQTGMPIVTELMDPRDIEVVCRHADIIQIGTRNMQNFRLLTEVGRVNKPVLLKRGLSASIKEWLMAAEYIASEGNRQIILCERGIRTFETATRNTLDISAIPIVKKETHLPIIVDPSHAGGKRDLVAPLAKAALAAGADGLMIEVHPSPETALCDGAQSLPPDQFARLMDELRPLAAALGKSIG
jgi:3-deoxy-7-phosphoheptulonate synthase